MTINGHGGDQETTPPSDGVAATPPVTRAPGSPGSPPELPPCLPGSPKPPPWIAFGCSKSTYYRRIVRQRIVEARSAGYTRVVAAVIAELGGEDEIGEVKMTIVKRFASLSAIAAELEDRMLRGDEFDRKELISATALLSRLAKQLGVMASKTDATSLSDYLAGKIGGMENIPPNDDLDDLDDGDNDEAQQ